MTRKEVRLKPKIFLMILKALLNTPNINRSYNILRYKKLSLKLKKI